MSLFQSYYYFRYFQTGVLHTWYEEQIYTVSIDMVSANVLLIW